MSKQHSNNFMKPVAAAAACVAVAGAGFLGVRFAADKFPINADKSAAVSLLPSDSKQVESRVEDAVNSVINETKPEVAEKSEYEKFSELSAAEKLSALMKNTDFNKWQGITYVSPDGRTTDTSPIVMPDFSENMIDINEHFENDDVRVDILGMYLSGTKGYMIYEAENKNDFNTGKVGTRIYLGFEGINTNVNDLGEKFCYDGPDERGVINARIDDTYVDDRYRCGDIVTNIIRFDDLDLVSGKPWELNLSVVEVHKPSAAADKCYIDLPTDFTFTVNMPEIKSEIKTAAPAEPLYQTFKDGEGYITGVVVEANGIEIYLDSNIEFGKILGIDIGQLVAINMKDGSKMVVDEFCELNESDLVNRTDKFIGYGQSFITPINTDDVVSVEIGDIIIDMP